MNRNIKGYAIKLTSALFIAAAIMSVGTTVAKADEIDTQIEECVETVVEGQGDVIDDQFAVAPEAEAQPATETEVEGQGDIIDDEFAVTEGWGDVIDDEFAYVEEQGDVIDDCFAVAPEAEVQPATETSTEAPADNKVVLQTTNGTYEEITILMPEQGNFYNPIKDGVIDPLSLLPVEGQGDVIDDEFAYVEGQGDVIDDEFAYVEGQGDVIDDQVAVTPEAAVETVEVAENNTEVTAPSVNSFVAVGSADSLAAVGSADSAKNDEEYKSELTKTLEEFNKGLSPLNVEYGDPIRKKVNDCDFLGDDEKEYINEIVTTGLSTGEGVIFGEFIPGFGAFRKAAKMVESVSKALDASDANKKEDALKYTVETFTNGTEAIVSAIPGGSLALAGAKVQNALAGYCAKKITSFFKWLF